MKQYQYTYTDNFVIPPKVLNIITLDKLDILEADNMFKKECGVDPLKKPSIGCSLKVIDFL